MLSPPANDTQLASITSRSPGFQKVVSCCGGGVVLLGDACGGDGGVGLLLIACGGDGGVGLLMIVCVGGGVGVLPFVACNVVGDVVLLGVSCRIGVVVCSPVSFGQSFGVGGWIGAGNHVVGVSVGG
jgi:hypothetical protein